ncbi:tRNA (N6-threonylcarbamoyladenosine(37)-N6)-methyltransferase TrmO [Nannocystaceae bacterium ST9]
MTERFELAAIGHVRSPWREKFGVPRQSGLAQVEATIELDPDWIPREALRGLEQVSHLWIVSWFHGLHGPSFRPTVRPPRLGGATRLGVLATRSPHRPNPIGLSVVRLLGIDDRTLRVRGVDLLDGTPVLDLKPYVPWADVVDDAVCEWADAAPRELEVRFADALAGIDDQLRATIIDTLRWDPRPAHQRGEAEREYAMRLLDVDVRFRVDADGVLVLAIGCAGPAS